MYLIFACDCFWQHCIVRLVFKSILNLTLTDFDKNLKISDILSPENDLSTKKLRYQDFAYEYETIKACGTGEYWTQLKKITYSLDIQLKR